MEDLFPHLPGFFSLEYGFLSVVLILMICGLGLPMPEEIPLFFAGYFVYTGEVNLITACFWTSAAILFGDSALFFIGRYSGPKIFRNRWFRRYVKRRNIKKVNAYLQKYGSWVVFVGRFLAGLRGPIFLITGILRMPYKKFIFFDGLATLISVPVSIYFSFFLCNRFSGELELAKQKLFETKSTIGLITLTILAAWGLYTLFNKRSKS